VSISDYQNNIEQMIDICHNHNITPFLLTAPYYFEIIPEYYYSIFPRNMNLIEVHKSYNNIVKKIGLLKNVKVIDLEQMLNQAATKSYFYADGVHLNINGRTFIADAIAEYF